MIRRSRIRAPTYRSISWVRLVDRREGVGRAGTPLSALSPSIEPECEPPVCPCSVISLCAPYNRFPLDAPAPLNHMMLSAFKNSHVSKLRRGISIIAEKRYPHLRSTHALRVDSLLVPMIPTRAHPLSVANRCPASQSANTRYTTSGTA